MPLTHTAVVNAKRQAKEYKLYDEKGLYVIIAASGGKLWRLKFRFDGKEDTLSLGAYPDVSLKQVREKRDEARALLAAGVNPKANRKAAKAAKAVRAANSFEVVTREWLVQRSRERVPRHAARVTRLFERDLFPWLGACPSRTSRPPICFPS